MTTTQRTRPSWYTTDDDTAWTKVKAAFQRDWEQTKHDFGGKAPDLDQNAGDTVSQASGSKPIPPANVKTPHPNKTDKNYVDSDTYVEADEPAYRYGYAARSHFDTDWDDSTEANLRKEWGDDTDWPRARNAIRRGWEYRALERRNAPR